jgi:hypothetical protein
MITLPLLELIQQYGWADVLHNLSDLAHAESLRTDFLQQRRKLELISLDERLRAFAGRFHELEKDT